VDNISSGRFPPKGLLMFTIMQKLHLNLVICEISEMFPSVAISEFVDKSLGIRVSHPERND